MASWYAYIPMSIFTFQIFLALGGKDPMAIFTALPVSVINTFLSIVQTGAF